MVVHEQSLHAADQQHLQEADRLTDQNALIDRGLIMASGTSEEFPGSPRPSIGACRAGLAGTIELCPFAARTPTPEEGVWRGTLVPPAPNRYIGG